MLQSIYQSQGGSELCDTLMKYIYRGMAQAPTPSQSKTTSPQQTGFSQIGGRLAGMDGQGHNMSVLLSWHEKVGSRYTFKNSESAAKPYEIACRDSWSR